jgi:hypothetical protein
MDLFFDALKSGSEFPISLEKQLDVMRIIDSAYRLNKPSAEKQPDINQMIESNYQLNEAK